MEAKQVMIVDDNAEVLHIISKSLVRAGFQVVGARNGLEALNSLENNPPAVIVSDVMMPKMTGYELCRAVRSRGLADVPFLLMSSLSSPADRVLGLRLGADDYLVKPVDPEELLLKVRKYIHQNEKRETRFLRKAIQEAGDYLSLQCGPKDIGEGFAQRAAGILSLVENHHSVGGVLDGSLFTNIDTLRILYALLKMGILRAGADPGK